VGLVAVLASPVSWIHHLAWLAVVIPALVGDGRDRRRWAYAAVLTAWFLCRLPWWGITWYYSHRGTRWIGQVMQNADTAGAVLALVLIWLVLRRLGEQSPPDGGAPVAGSRLEAEAHAGRLQPGDGAEQEAQPAADPADRRQPHPA
jgi:alpha-1,2-mannosyltransferase